MAIYLEMPELDKDFPFRTLINDGNILTTPHWHREVELIYVTKGTISLGIDDIPYKLSEGEIAFISSGLIHYVLASPGSERLVYQFDLSYFASLNKENLDLQKLFSELVPVSLYWKQQQEEIIRQLLESIQLEMDTQQTGYQFVVKAAIFQLISLLIRDIPKQTKQPKKMNKLATKDVLEKLDEIFRYVEDYYQEDITLRNIADVSGYSTFYFTKFFKRNTGKTFLTFLNDYRIDKAKWLLINSDYSVSEIITRTGFESDKTFYRLFKKSMDIAPLEYRNRMKID
ncbi:helix-turn-helix transcriptional regulator [Candidatus Enterococcus ferrettii]|uniref:HTH araC/xylS-type domain-containing protein n=1 Tax=Candidatus Enterococcus ferrettii TaxID=2815324 RepID=A0ABV0EUW8_9ENTE|nr:AraC family transcriptional regulator [Enterococcus sp. 665A]MBO1339360.1 helix-turn-helix transcriptional regulator [Enterococcus sp. 665A]